MQFLAEKNHCLKFTANLLSALTLLCIFNWLLRGTISTLNEKIQPLAPMFSIAGCVLLLMVNIPWVIVDMPIVKNGFLRVLSIVIIDVSFTMNANDFIKRGGSGRSVASG